jgi:quercetin dioxygenase-like cupin family protein
MTFTQAGPAASTVKVVEPGGGMLYSSEEDEYGIGVAFKIDGEDTGGSVAIVEHPFAVGAFAPPHLHRREDEFSIVLEGQIGFRSEDQEVVLGPGGYIVKPHGEVHAMWNAGDVPARMIEVIAPAGLDRYFQECAELARQGESDMQTWVDLGEDYGVSFEEPTWWADVMDRYGLTDPPTV